MKKEKKQKLQRKKNLLEFKSIEFVVEKTANRIMYCGNKSFLFSIAFYYLLKIKKHKLFLYPIIFCLTY